MRLGKWWGLQETWPGSEGGGPVRRGRCDMGRGYYKEPDVAPPHPRTVVGRVRESEGKSRHQGM